MFRLFTPLFRSSVPNRAKIAFGNRCSLDQQTGRFAWQSYACRLSKRTVADLYDDKMHDRQFVADHQQGDVGGRANLLQQNEQVALHRDVEPGGRFIGGQNNR